MRAQIVCEGTNIFKFVCVSLCVRVCVSLTKYNKAFLYSLHITGKKNLPNILISLNTRQHYVYFIEEIFTQLKSSFEIEENLSNSN